MISQTHYLIRSKTDGSYLVARPDPDTVDGYLLVFREYADALSYLNTHAGDRAPEFGVESVSGVQLRGVLTRWGFAGLGLVEDPLIPQVQFMRQV
ncbi:MAG: hypothetical protein HC838_04925 [Spirulinaceae cyanobacterium RM2_2_10]|nr:hypothetical protein [Spirulinaceae cyanobacterium SM2_1_0]NJO19524.1 hypothetical protein [Spirulinaceae cyanobacterium RM2_2_10]